MGKAREKRARFRGKAETGLSATHLATAVAKASTGKARVPLKQGSKTVAAVVPAEDLATLERLDDLADAETCRAALADWERDGKRTTPLKKIVAKLGIRP